MIRWPWSRPHQPEVEDADVGTVPPPVTSLVEARAARVSSELALQAALLREREVRAQGARLRHVREVNGFAADIRAAMRHR